MDWLRDDLDPVALAALALLAAGAVALLAVVKPLEARARALEQRLELRAVPGAGMTRVSAAPASRLDAFYRYFERANGREEWLATLHTMAGSAGLELRSGEYRLADSRQRIERYRVTLPVTGSYAQLRVFLREALAAIPVLSLDQVSFRRRAAGDARIEAEIVFTLHQLRS